MPRTWNQSELDQESARRRRRSQQALGSRTGEINLIARRAHQRGRSAAAIKERLDAKRTEQAGHPDSSPLAGVKDLFVLLALLGACLFDYILLRALFDFVGTGSFAPLMGIVLVLLEVGIGVVVHATLRDHAWARLLLQGMLGIIVLALSVATAYEAAADGAEGALDWVQWLRVLGVAGLGALVHAFVVFGAPRILTAVHGLRLGLVAAVLQLRGWLVQGGERRDRLAVYAGFLGLDREREAFNEEYGADWRPRLSPRAVAIINEQSETVQLQVRPESGAQDGPEGPGGDDDTRIEPPLVNRRLDWATEPPRRDVDEVVRP